MCALTGAPTAGAGRDVDLDALGRGDVRLQVPNRYVRTPLAQITMTK
jgi:hypothetical protein